MPAEALPPPLPNSYWVLPGKLLAGEHPRRSPAAAETLERLHQLMDAGIDCFFDLTMPGEMDSYENELPPGVVYVRKPVIDHGIPARREQMVDIIAHLQQSLASGRRVYVHCRAGIGRTGTVIGCFLVERGWVGEGALDELNRLWQQSERSQSWSYVPETEEQVAFVHDWTPVARAAGNAAPPAPTPVSIPVRPAARPAAPLVDRGLRDRFQGALLGLAIGDALAVPTQGRRAGSFESVSDLRGGGPFQLPGGAWSDDTAMALCLAESLLECNGFAVHDQVERYCRWQREGYLSATGVCVGIRPHTARALAAAQWRRQVFAGSHDPKQLDPEVLSRVAPAVMFAFDSVENAVAMACDAARTTCQAPVVVETCREFATLLHAALGGRAKDRVLLPKPQTTHTASSTAPHVLATAIWAFRSTDNFQDALLRAANVGGNSDVVAAVCGQLAGAWYGARAIPPLWRNVVFQRERIVELANRLFAHCA